MHLLKHMWTVAFLRDILCEFGGTTLFLFVGFATIVLPGPSSTLQVSLAFGIAVGLVCLCLEPATLRGLQLNPAVSLALVVGLRVSLLRAGLCVGAQLLGALCACALLLAVGQVPLNLQNVLSQVAPGVHTYQAFIVEMIITFPLVLSIFATASPTSTYHRFGPLMVALSVIQGHFVAISFTGCGMNPARSFAPAVVALNFHNHWVYWAGPCAGAVLAALLHDLVLYPRWRSYAEWLNELKEVSYKDLQKQQVQREHAPDGLH